MCTQKQLIPPPQENATRINHVTIIQLIVYNIKEPLWAVDIVRGTFMPSGYRNLPYLCFASTWNTVFLNPSITVLRKM
jgi:hypothetical protein